MVGYRPCRASFHLRLKPRASTRRTRHSPGYNRAGFQSWLRPENWTGFIGNGTANSFGFPGGRSLAIRAMTPSSKLLLPEAAAGLFVPCWSDANIHYLESTVTG